MIKLKYDGDSMNLLRDVLDFVARILIIYVVYKIIYNYTHTFNISFLAAVVMNLLMEIRYDK